MSTENKNNVVVMRDKTGKLVNVDLAEVVKGLQTSNVNFFDMDMGAVLQLREEYIRMGGTIPITKVNVKALMQVIEHRPTDAGNNNDSSNGKGKPSK